MMDSLITSNTVVVAAEGIASADLDGEAILLDINSGHYYGLNEVGARILELVQEPVAVNTITEILLQEYEVRAEQLVRDVMSFLQTMGERQLIRAMNGAVV